ncbi:MAG: S9 family peptidase [Acidobacteria bacterium]|nr:S9 family peptidase [Acidobacteriota bacterium]
MSKHNRFFVFFLLFLFVATAFAVRAEEPPRGRALYEMLRTDRSLIGYEGERRIAWTPDGKAYYQPEKGTFLKYDIQSGEKSPLFDDAKIIAAFNAQTKKAVNKLPFQRFEFLKDGQVIKFSAGPKNYLYDLESGEMTAYIPPPSISGVRGRTYTEVHSPDLRWIAYTRDYNLYVADVEGGEKAFTTDGHKDLRNAFPDWVYPEELNQYTAFWWSPDSTKIAYMQFDESPVSKYPIVHDIDPKPELELQSYPKAGANNPIVRLFVVDIKTKNITRLQTGMETNVYLYNGQWTADGKEFTYMRLNRWQNTVELFAADPETGETRLILTDKDPCYLEPDSVIFLADGIRFLWTSERSGWKEIYLYDISGTLIRQLTKAGLAIGSISGVDEPNGWVYFTGQENHGLERHGYRVGLDETTFTRLTKEPGSHSLSLSPDFTLYTDSFSSFDTPPRMTLHKTDGTPIRTLGESVITSKFEDLKLIQPEHFTFKSADGGYDLDGHVYFPAHFDKNETSPLILSVYGGPGSKQAANRYGMNSGNQALAQLGFIVANVDHRGVSGRGKAFQNLMYLNMGEIELEDHVAGVKHLAQRPYIDGSRVGIYGHSYGGYLTCIALLKAPDVFHVGVSGAPVTDWRNYDSIYTERYMRLPQDNPEGYRKSSCMTYAKDLEGKLFIHHGAVDDNVHPGNSIQLIYALLQAGKRFDFMLYPEQQHGIRFNQYSLDRIDYFIEHLKPIVK